MKLNLVSFRMTVGYGAMILFIGIPIVRTLLGTPLSITELVISYAIAISFGLYATHELEKYDNEKKADNLFKRHKEEFRSEDCKDRKLKEKCPDCGSELKEISKVDPKKKIFGSKALIYCTVCDFEEPKEDYDRRFM